MAEAGTESRGSGPAEQWPRLIHHRDWTDDKGTRWHMRGHALDARGARRLLKRPEVIVLHVEGPRPEVLSGAGREALLARVDQFFAGEEPPMSTFDLAEFRDERHRVMLVVEESC